ncbi:shikimate dehydrogenase [Demequina lignilytica]|uniref:Shikimate dehydrogenase n=1 Tax=Demequina lignilytica TaxID=3051663 RepID=A0AB35ME92_9MICO|nr:shikimate dehydrogenase [Demequina sp. SYSU T0a273]MDN4482058.1 shikimate dehydrogenase [Demequina sp. SYSU T0a273]
MTGSAAPRRAGVLGHPIGHSLSPTLHRAAYAALGIDWEYDAYDVDSGGLGAFIEGLDDAWAGLSLTMPLKVEAVPLMDFVEPMAKLVGGCNTVLIQNVGGARHLVGANTDVWGIQAAFREAGVTAASSGLILGGGATATSAMAALGSLGVTAPYVAVRSRGRAGGLLRAATRMGVAPRFVTFEEVPALAAHVDVAVSTVPAAAGADIASSLVSVSECAALLDAVYEPLVTPLGARWADLGGVRIGGERMLLHQAGEQIRLMTGREAPLAAMDDAMTRVLHI